jgi:hypothetical protein
MRGWSMCLLRFCLPILRPEASNPSSPPRLWLYFQPCPALPCPALHAGHPAHYPYYDPLPYPSVLRWCLWVFDSRQVIDWVQPGLVSPFRTRFLPPLGCLARIPLSPDLPSTSPLPPLHLFFIPSSVPHAPSALLCVRLRLQNLHSVEEAFRYAAEHALIPSARRVEPFHRMQPPTLARRTSAFASVSAFASDFAPPPLPP